MDVLIQLDVDVDVDVLIQPLIVIMLMEEIGGNYSIAPHHAVICNMTCTLADMHQTPSLQNPCIIPDNIYQ